MLRQSTGTLELSDLLQERIEHLVVVFGGKNVRLEPHTKVCVARRSCGASADGSSWNRSRWLRGQADDGMICWSCWIA
jgi:hypothetical protein